MHPKGKLNFLYLPTFQFFTCTGNNIPSEILKAIETSLQRNMELQASCKEQQTLAASYKQRLENVESEKNTQVFSICLQKRQSMLLKINDNDSV